MLSILREKINIKKIRAQEESFGQLGLCQTTDCREWENFVFTLHSLPPIYPICPCVDPNRITNPDPQIS